MTITLSPDQDNERIGRIRAAINEKIEQAAAQIDRGEGIPLDELRVRLEKRKADRLAGHDLSQRGSARG